MFSFPEMVIECLSCNKEIFIPDDAETDVFECPYCQQKIKLERAEEEEVVPPTEPPPVIQKTESEQLNQQNKNTAKLRNWTGNTAGLSFLSLLIPVFGLFLSIPFWISSFILCIICLAKGEYSRGVGTMIFLIFVMPIAFIIAFLFLADGY
jgi:DNA-directed RNA polymerase subunit RPC12/RpoP